MFCKSICPSTTTSQGFVAIASDDKIKDNNTG
jgi:hypothetical protein